MSIRTKQVESVLIRAVSDAIRGLSDPRITGMVSVTEVDVSPDLRNAKVSVSIVPAERSGIAMHALREAATHVHKRVCQIVELKRVPHLNFKLDESIKKQAEVFEAIKRGMERTGEIEEETPPTAPGDTGIPEGEEESNT